MTTEKFTFFWQEQSPFSQWHRPAPFVHKNIKFSCAEQAMMWEKAMLFGDTEIAEKVLKATHPREYKALGRQVKNFKESVWVANRKHLVKEINHAKFKQNPHLMKALLATYGTTLVEASPYDDIWGIKLEASDPRAQKRETWRGLNLLGEVLTELCNEFMAENGESLEWLRGLPHSDLVEMLSDIYNCGSIEAVKKVFDSWKS